MLDGMQAVPGAKGSRPDSICRFSFHIAFHTHRRAIPAMPCSEFVVSGMGRECSELSEFRNVFDCHSFTHGRRAVTQAKSSPIPDVSAFQFHEGHLAEARPPSA